MIKKWIFAAGAGVGYVLGTRAGRQKYDAMVGKAREVMDRPDVKEATEAIAAQANRLYDEGRHLVGDKVRELRIRSGHHRTASGVGTNNAGGYPGGPELTPLPGSNEPVR